MSETGYALFDTALGRCAIGWTEAGVACLRWPAADDAAARSAISRARPDLAEAEPPPAVQGAIAGVQALTAGERRDLVDVVLDERPLTDLQRRTYAIARTVGPGSTTTYGEIAVRLGDKALAREVGRLMGLNPYPIIMPCHRVLAADGRTGGFSAPGGVNTKFRLLAIARATIDETPSLFDDLPLAIAPR